MRVLSLALLGVSLATATLEAQRAAGGGNTREAERRWSLAADGSVKIFNFAGTIRVIGWERDSVVASATLPPGLALFGGGGQEGLKLGIEGEQNRPEHAATLVVRVPATANIWIRGASTDVTVEGLIGIVDVGTVSGSLVVSGSPRTLTAETMDGALLVRGSPESLRARTASGELRWEGAAQNAPLGTVSGTVRVSDGPLGRARIESVTGAVFVGTGLRRDADLTIETHSGNVEVVIARDTPVRLSVDAADFIGRSSRVFAPNSKERTREVELNIRDPKAPAARLTIRSFKGAVRVNAP
jgi:DUF4097 and DUF4098 domain-containing protein YvlB